MVGMGGAAKAFIPPANLGLAAFYLLMPPWAMPAPWAGLCTWGIPNGLLEMPGDSAEGYLFAPEAPLRLTTKLTKAWASSNSSGDAVTFSLDM